jgi:hypothetical protein
VVVAGGVVVAALRFGQGASTQPVLSNGAGRQAEQDNTGFAVDVRTVPEFASVLLDGSPVGTGHYQTNLPRDGVQHELRVEAPGFITQRFGFRDAAPPADFALSPVPPVPQQRVESVASGSGLFKGGSSQRRGLLANGLAKGGNAGFKDRTEGGAIADPLELDDSLATRGSLSAAQQRGQAARGRGNHDAAQAPAGAVRNAQPAIAPRVRIVDGAEPRVRLID